MKRKVAVTGMGVVSSLGCSLEKFWSALKNGVSGVGTISRYRAGGLPVRIAAEVRDFPWTNGQNHICRYSDSLSMPFDLRTQFAVMAAEQALKCARLGREALENANLYIGAGEGRNSIDLLSRLLAPCFRGDEADESHSALIAAEFALHDQLMEATVPASLIAARYGIYGEVKTSLTACAASSQAIGEAMRCIQNGDCEVAIAGGTHTMTAPLDVLGFSMLSALSKRNDQPEKASRPFDRNRDGFVLGEAAGILTLEDYEVAEKRGVRIYAEMIGYGTSCDAYRVTDMHPEALGAIDAIEFALADAGISPKEIGYVNAHGTSTIENDRTETRALRTVFGKYADQIPVSSTKSMTGHAVAAAGVIELIASILALSDQIVPPTINLETPDPECDLDYIPNRARAHNFDIALSNSFGFGGQNVALLARAVKY